MAGTLGRLTIPPPVLVPSGSSSEVVTLKVTPTTPTRPAIQIGPQVAGCLSITSTTLKPTIPNVSGKMPRTLALPPVPAGPPVIPKVPGQSLIQLPRFDTLIPPVIVTTIKRPVAIPRTPPTPTGAPLPGSQEYIMGVLAEINPELFVAERIGKNKKGYSRNALIAFVNRLGMSASGKNKPDLIEMIQKMRQDMGLT